MFCNHSSIEHLRTLRLEQGVSLYSLDMLVGIHDNGACRRAGTEGFPFHDFRHTSVTDLRAACLDHLTIMTITGHKTMAVFKSYNSLRVNDLKEAASRFNAYLTLVHTPQVIDSLNSLKLKDAPVAQLDRASAF